MKNKMRAYLADHISVMERVVSDLMPTLEHVAIQLINCLVSGKKILVMGNGGSAADAQHFAAELVGRFVIERQALPAIALTTDSSILTAVGNDYGFEKIFQRQIQALANPGDLVLGISTSGNSLNILRGVDAARQQGCTTVGLLGSDGGEIATGVDYALIAPSKITAHVQEVHIVLLHLLCLLVDEAFALKEEEHE